MERHYELNDDQFEQQFKSRQLDPAIFSHEAHLRLAWIHITKYGLEKAIENICAQLFGYVEKLGATNKYNHTVTIAAIRAVNHFAAKSVADNFSDFIREFPRLKTNFKEIIRTHYSQDIFHIVSARRQYLEPDLLPFS